MEEWDCDHYEDGRCGGRIGFPLPVQMVKWFGKAQKWGTAVPMATSEGKKLDHMTQDKRCSDLTLIGESGTTVGCVDPGGLGAVGSLATSR